MSAWRCRCNKDKVVLQTIGLVRACPHLQYNVNHDPLINLNQTDLPVRCLNEAFAVGLTEVEFRGHGSHTPQISPSRHPRYSRGPHLARSWAWRPPLNPKYKAHIRDVFCKDTCNSRSGDIAGYHAPDSVRNMYETSPNRGFTPSECLRKADFNANGSPFYDPLLNRSYRKGR